jgi:hypothetical protein
MTARAPHTRELVCAGCGVKGRVSTIAEPQDDRRPILRIAWTKDGPKLMCALCRAGEAP